MVDTEQLLSRALYRHFSRKLVGVNSKFISSEPGIKRYFGELKKNGYEKMIVDVFQNGGSFLLSGWLLGCDMSLVNNLFRYI